jgi:hypothetical protein
VVGLYSDWVDHVSGRPSSDDLDHLIDKRTDTGADAARAVRIINRVRRETGARDLITLTLVRLWQALATLGRSALGFIDHLGEEDTGARRKDPGSTTSEKRREP